MEEIIKEANLLANEDGFGWPKKFILELEKKKKNTAIIWVINFVSDKILSSNYNEKQDWIQLLNRLEMMVAGKVQAESMDLCEKAKIIFNMPPARNQFLSIISHLYVAQAYFIKNDFDLYINRLTLLVANWNDLENRLSPEMENLMIAYVKFIR